MINSIDVTKSKTYPMTKAAYDYDVDNEPYEDITGYRSLIMSMRYIAQTVKPDALLAASYLSTKQSAPCIREYKSGINLLSYLYGVHDQVIHL